MALEVLYYTCKLYSGRFGVLHWKFSIIHASYIVEDLESCGNGSSLLYMQVI